MSPSSRASEPGVRRRRLRDGTVPLRKLVPNMFTTAALCCGLASLYFTEKGDFATAIVAIGMSAILDALDGRAARLLKVTSRFGEVFDSISDFVGFCVGPAYLHLRWCQPDLRFLGIHIEGLLVITVIIYGVCGAMRLARFTAMQARKKPGSKPSEFFTGMPTPAAAGAALIPPMLLLSRTLSVRVPTILVIALLLVISGLMISKLPMFSFKRLRVSRRWLIPLMLLTAVTVAGFIRDPWLTASIVAAVYMLSLPLSIRAAERKGVVDGGPSAPLDPPAATST